MIKLLSRYITVGIANTAIHWAVFGSMVYVLRYEQATSNMVAFFIAVTFSFFANAKLTFDAKATPKRYMLFASFIGSASFVLGWISDRFNIHPFITLVEFSIISLVCGFTYSKLIVFRDPK